MPYHNPVFPYLKVTRELPVGNILFVGHVPLILFMLFSLVRIFLPNFLYPHYLNSLINTQIRSLFFLSLPCGALNKMAPQAIGCGSAQRLVDVDVTLLEEVYH